MNKKAQALPLLGALLAVIAIAGLIATTAAVSAEQAPEAAEAPQQTQTPVVQPTLSAQQATAIALQIVPGSATDAELIKLNGVLAYGVEIDQDNQEYEVIVDAETGAILRTEKETSNGRQEVTILQSTVTEEVARTIALQAVSGEVEEIEIELVNGNYAYVVEIENGNSEFEVSVDVITGKIVDIEEEVTAPLPTNTAVSQNRAIQIAQDRVGASYDFDEIESSTRSGKDVWIVELEGRGQEAEVIINAQTGAILSIQYEDDD